VSHQTTDFPDADERVCSMPEVARVFDCSVRSVQRIISANELPFVQISPRRVGILQSDVRAYLQARRQWRPGAGPGAVPRRDTAHA
jgi:predicted DNA-binding transcriptional regulator AlpA